MALLKRGETYWCDITIPGASRTRESTGTRDRVAAQEYHDALKARLWREAKLGEQKRVEYTWDDAALRWLREKAGKKDYKGDCRKIEWLSEFFTGKPLRMLTSEIVAGVIEGHKGGTALATRNRYTALIRSIMRRAWLKWKWLKADEVPYLCTPQENNERTRFLDGEQFRMLMRELPEHLKPLVAFSVATGLRMSNATGLKWKDVDLTRRSAIIVGKKMKNGQPLGVPLNDMALAVLEAQKGKHPDVVFTYNGRPIGMAGARAWRNALARAGITDFRWHDLRHTWASWLMQAGASEFMVQQLGGWKSRKMVERYAVLNVEHLAPTANLIGRVLPGIGYDTTGSQPADFHGTEVVVSG